METARNNNRVLIVIILAAFLACGWLMMRNGHHVDMKHGEAVGLRSVINSSASSTESDGYHSRLSLYYSELHGTLLMLFRMGDWKAAGWVIKITEVQHGQVVSMGHRIYERTCFVADQTYWSAVIARDAYMPIAVSLSIPALIIPLVAALVVVVRKLRGDGHRELADRIEREFKS